MSILSPVAAQFQSLVKKLSDSALAQALQMHADPSDPKGFWLAQEAMGRSAARKEAQAASANSPTVVQQLAQQLNPPPPQMPPQMPPQGVATAMPPQMPPQAPPVAMAQAGGHVHDYGVASLPYTPRYEHGGIVSFNGENESYVNSIDYWKDGYPELDTSLRNEEIDQEVDAMFGETPEESPAAPKRNEATDAYQAAMEKGSPQRVDFGYDLLNSAAYIPALAADALMTPVNLARYAFKSGMVDLSPEGLAHVKETGRPRSREEANPTNPYTFSSGLSPFGFGVSTYDPNEGTTSEKPKSEETKPAAPFNPNWLMSATAAPSLMQQPEEETAPATAAPELAPTAPRRIVEVTGQPGGIPSYAGLPALNTDPGKPPSIKDFPLDETTGKPKPFSMEDEAERKKIQNELSRREGYNPNLTTEFLTENQKDIEDLKKEEGTRALRDVFRAMTQGFGSTGSFAQGLGAFGQAISKNFDESEKVIDAKKTAFKKYNKELRLAQNDFARGEVDKGMGRYQKAEDAMQAFEQRLADNRNKFIISQREQDRQDYRSKVEQAAANQRLMISEAGDTARAQHAANIELQKAEATRAAATQDKLINLIISGRLNESDYFNKLKEVSENVDEDAVARFIAQTQGIPVDQVDVGKITPADVEHYAPIIAKEIVVDLATRAISASNDQKAAITPFFVGLRSLGKGYTATPVQP